MSIFQRRRAQDLSDWLHIATGKLAPAAKERICADITSHYDEAVAERMQSGLPMCAAQAAALADLGDAKAAARRFRQTHLTESEFRLVTRMGESPRRCNWQARVAVEALFCLACLILLLLLYLSPTTDIMEYVVIALLPVLRIIALALARYESAVPTPRALLLMESVHVFSFGMLFLVQIIMFATTSALGWELVVLFGMTVGGFFMIGHSLWLFRLRNKLGTMAEDGTGEAGTARSEIPPDKPIAS